MLRIAVLVSGGGTNLQAIIDGVEQGKITNTEICCVISNNPGAYALKRAEKHKIEGVCISPADYRTREEFHDALLNKLLDLQVDLIVLAGCLVVIPPSIVRAFPGKIINVHPALIPSFCGTGYYGLKVHEAVLKRGVKVTGATVHFVNEIPDGGRIISQKAVYIEDGDTPETLQRRVMEQAEWIILPAAAEAVAEELEGRE